MRACCRTEFIPFCASPCARERNEFRSTFGCGSAAKTHRPPRPHSFLADAKQIFLTAHVNAAVLEGRTGDNLVPHVRREDRLGFRWPRFEDERLAVRPE